MSLDEKEEKKERHKCEFESELKNIYDIKNQNGIIFIHENEVNKISEYNLLHDILNPSEHSKILNCYYSPILHGFMNTRKGKAKLKNFQIRFDS